MMFGTSFRELIPILARTDPMFREPRRPSPKAAVATEAVERIRQDVAELRAVQSELLRNQEELRKAVEALRAGRAAG